MDEASIVEEKAEAGYGFQLLPCLSATDNVLAAFALKFFKEEFPPPARPMSGLGEHRRVELLAPRSDG